MTLKANKIHLFRSMERAEAYAKKLALDGVFVGHKCTTPLNFVSDLVNSEGFRDDIVTKTQRIAHLLSVVSSTDDLGAADYFYKTQNLGFLIQFIEQAVGSDEFFDALDSIEDEEDVFSFLEESTIIIAQEYEEVLDAFDLSEFGSAAALTSDELAGIFDVSFEDECEISQTIRSTIERVAFNYADASFYAFKTKEHEHNHKTFIFAALSETQAKNAVFIDVLTQLEDGHKVAFITNDVEDDAATLERLCSQMNLNIKIGRKQKKNFLDTNFGQALLACDEALHGSPRSVEVKFSNFMHNPLSGVSLYKCLELEKDLRANPTVARQRVADELKDISPTFDLFMSVVEEPFAVDKTLLLDAIAAHIEGGLSLNNARKRENLAALEAFRDFASTLCLIGYDDELDYEVLRCVNISAKCITGDETATRRIDLFQPSVLNRLAGEQFDNVVFCDVSSKAFNASTSFDSMRTLLNKMGIVEEYSSSDKARINFQCGIEASKHDVVFCLPQRDLRNNEELTPSFVLQELFLKKYGQPLNFDNLASQCEKLNINYRAYGEDNLALIGNALITQSDISRNVHPLSFHASAVDNIENCLTLTDDGKVILSPSEIETYCQCPYKWFYERRVSPQTLDYEFNQIEKGNIVHLAFKLFYDELYEQGVFRLNDVPDAQSKHELFGECYNKAVRQVLSVSNSEGADGLKVDDFLNAFDIMQSLNDCFTCLAIQSMFPKKYIVAESEMRIESQQRVEYAGVVINGVLDRLDVSPETDSFIVVDYKGSIRDHGCGKDAFSLISDALEDVPLPSKIQTLIYASCVQRMTGKKCDAAIYVSYNKLKHNTPPVVGAIDVSVVDDFYDVLGDAKESTVDIGMPSYLDATEVRVRARLDDLRNGNVYPRPLTKNTCEFCSVPNCPMRGRG